MAPRDGGSKGGTSSPLCPRAARRHVQLPLQIEGLLCCLQVFANEVNAHRDRIIELDQTGNQLKFLSQKQDVVLIKNLLVSVQARWEKVVQRSVERGRALDDARKRAKQVRNVGRVRQTPRYGQPWRAGGPKTRKGLGTPPVLSFRLTPVSLQFHEAWKKLIDWLEDAENHLDSELEISNDPDKIKLQLSKHKVELCQSKTGAGCWVEGCFIGGGAGQHLLCRQDRGKARPRLPLPWKMFSWGLHEHHVSSASQGQAF